MFTNSNRNSIKRYVVTILTLLYFILPSNAQHCEWDNSALIAVRPMYEGKFVEDLKIELIDTDNPYSTKIETHKNRVYTLYKENIKTFAKRKSHDRIKKLRYVDFVNNDYTVITGSHFKEGLFIKITDVRGNRNRPKLRTQIIPVTEEHLLGLCGIRDGLNYNDSLYKPIVVVLSSDQMMKQYHCDLSSKTIQAITFYTAPTVYKEDSVIFQIIQTAAIYEERALRIKREYFKIHPYPFALQHFDSLKNIYIDEKGFILDYPPVRKSIQTASSTKNLVNKHNTLGQEEHVAKVTQANHEFPSLRAFIAHKLANGNKGMEQYYLERNIEQFKSTFFYEYLDTYNDIESEKLEFDLDGDRDMDYCIVSNRPKPHIEFYIFDNVLSKYVLDTLISKASYWHLNLKEYNLIVADYPIQQLFEMNEVKTYKRWNNSWQLIEWELQDYLTPHNNMNESRRRRLNDTLCIYDARTKQYIQHADYNFDGRMDTRIAHDSNVVFHNTSYYCEQFEYFIYDKEKGILLKDEFLSSGTFTFDFSRKTAVGYVEKRNYTKQKTWHSISNKYEWIENKFVHTEIVEQIQACPNCEKTITIRSQWINGKWQEVGYDPGAE